MTAALRREWFVVAMHESPLCLRRSKAPELGCPEEVSSFAPAVTRRFTRGTMPVAPPPARR